MNAQSVRPDVVSSGGSFFEGANSSLSWTLGETITETSEIPNVHLTQGFQQSSYTIVNVYEKPESEIKVSIFPNPAVNYINVNISYSNETFEVWLIDMNGNIVFNETSVQKSTKIDLKGFSASNYLLKIKSSDGNVIKSYKIIKNR